MTKELVQKLRPHVTTFSAAVPTQYKHGDTVRVGGVVTGILNMMELLSGALDEQYRKEGVYVTLDDGIGENQLVLAPKAFEIYESKHGAIKTGDVLLAEGRVFRLDTTHTFEGKRGKKVTVDNHEQDTIRILAYHAEPLPEDKPKEVVSPKAE